MEKIRMSGRKTENSRAFVKLMNKDLEGREFFYIKTQRLIPKDCIDITKNNPPIGFTLRKNILETELSLSLETAKLLFLALNDEFIKVSEEKCIICNKHKRIFGNDELVLNDLCTCNS